MESVWSVSKVSTESVGSRRELVANCVYTADADATKQFRRVGVGRVYWALWTRQAYELSQLWGARHFARKYTYEKLTKCRDFGNKFYVIFTRKK